jgi:hypothetical protein
VAVLPEQKIGEPLLPESADEVYWWAVARVHHLHVM